MQQSDCCAFAESMQGNWR